jgi:hypothetical protein
MDNITVLKTLVIGVLSAAIGYLSYTKSDLAAGLGATFAAAWILFQFRSIQDTWENLGNFQNPVLFGINSAFAAYIYTTINQVPSGKSMYISISMFMIGGAISLLIHKYWNMGP